MRRILLTGGTGQIGHALRSPARLAQALVAPMHAECDLADPASIEAALARIDPAIIINAAAYTSVDRAELETERELVYSINARAPGVLARWAARHDAMLVHYSTDYVFDGTKHGAYVETDPTAPLSVYGASKLAGEDAIRAANPRHLILRTSWVFGEHGGNFLKTMLAIAAREPVLRVVADQYGAPTDADWIASATAQILREPRTTGTFHMTAAGRTSWHEYAGHVIAGAIARGAELEARASSIEAITTAQFPRPARRPSNSVLDTTKLRAAYGIAPPDWRAGVDRVLDVLIRPSAS